jgi:hypothetical protein
MTISYSLARGGLPVPFRRRPALTQGGSHSDLVGALAGAQAFADGCFRYAALARQGAHAHVDDVLPDKRFFIHIMLLQKVNTSPGRASRYSSDVGEESDASPRLRALPVIAE